MKLSPTLDVITIVNSIGKGKTPQEVAKERGIDIKYHNFSSVKGVAFVDLNVVMVKKLYDKLWDEFVLWHEIGHCLLLKNKTMTTKLEEYHAEYEANMFAYLMMNESDEAYEIMIENNDLCFRNKLMQLMKSA